MDFHHGLLAEAVKGIASEKGCSPAQVALAWVLAQGVDIVPIPGTKHVRCLEENLGALQIRPMADELRRIEEVFPRGVTAGQRYPDGAMRFVNGRGIMESVTAKAIELETHPVALVWADEAPAGAVRFKPGRRGCVVNLFAVAATRGRAGAFDRRTFGCPGGGVGLGFGNQ